ncbi:MAG: SxtJ family membrane protein [Aquirufa sp.]
MNSKNSSQTILSIVVGLLAFGLIFKITYLFPIALFVGGASLLSTHFADFLSKIWLKFAQVLGRINSYILLTIIFFVFLTPIALLMKIIQKGDNLKLKRPIKDSVYETRNYTYQGKDLSNIW